MRLLTVLLGSFFLFLGIDKLSWFRDTSELSRFFERWLESATATNRWYLEHVALPGIEVWTRLVPLGELSVGVALLSAVLPRYAAVVAIFMVLNIQFASGALFRNTALTNANILPLLGGLLVIAMEGRHLPWSLNQAVAGRR